MLPPKSGHWTCPLYMGADLHLVSGAFRDGTRSSFFLADSRVLGFCFLHVASRGVA